MDESNSRIARLEAQVESIKEDVAEVKSDIKDLHSRITTGNREIMDKIDTKIDELSKADADQHDKLNAAISEVRKRVNVLEQWRIFMLGAAVVLGYLLSYIDLHKVFK